MNRLREIFYGKCGIDTLNKVIIGIGALFLILASVLDITPLAFVFMLCLIIFLYRALSDNLKARRAENEILTATTGHIMRFFKLRARMIREINTHKYFKCPRCSTQLRVPRGKGRISVKCSKCGGITIKTT